MQARSGENRMPQWAVDFDYRLDVSDHQLVSNVARVEALAKVIHGIPLPPTVQQRIDSLNIIRAVRGTTGIEGTEVSETEVERIIAASPSQRVLPDQRGRAEQEVRNAENVMRYVARILRQDPGRPVTEALIKELHSLTTQGIDYPINAWRLS
jgi:Fic family protein